MPCTPLHAALTRGHCQEVERLCQQHPEWVDAGDDDGIAPLHLACGGKCRGVIEYRGACPHCVRVLLVAGADVHAADCFATTPLHDAVGQCVVELIKGGANVHARDQDGVQPLAAAAGRGDVVAVQLLLAAGADVQAIEERLGTALHYAAGECVSELIRAGADVHAKDENGMQPLAAAAGRGDVVAVQLLLAAGADVQAVEAQLGTALHYAAGECVSELIRAGADVHALDGGGRPPLTIAAHRGDAVAVQLLLAAGADVNAADHHGLTALHEAACRNEEAGCVQALIKAGADVNARAAGWATPLLQHLMYGVPLPSLSIVKSLLEAGADVMASDSVGMTGLTALLAGHGNREEGYVLQCLVALLRAACRLGGGGDLVHAGGMQFDEVDREALGDALVFAATTGWPSVMVLLLGCGADIGAVDGAGRTALHNADSIEVAQLLVGLNPSLAEVVDVEGLTAAQLAREEGRNEVASAIESPVPTARLLQLVGCGGEGTLPLVGRVLASRLPLTEQEWGEVQPNCPGLGRLLPAALSHSEAQAGCLVRCMCSADRQRLRTAALCLGRAQRECGVTLPAHVVQGSLAHFDFEL